MRVSEVDSPEGKYSIYSDASERVASQCQLPGRLHRQGWVSSEPMPRSCAGGQCGNPSWVSRISLLPNKCIVSYRLESWSMLKDLPGFLGVIRLHTGPI